MRQTQKSPAPAATGNEAKGNALETHNSTDAGVVGTFPIYTTTNNTVPAKFLNLAEVVGLAESPEVGPKSKAPALTPFYASAKTQAAAFKAEFYALVVDHDDDDMAQNDLTRLYDSYGVAYLAYTTSSHQQDKHGIVANRWKVVIPLSSPVNHEQYSKLAVGLTLHHGADGAQARTQQVFYAPNKLTPDAPYQHINATERPLLDPDDMASPLVVAALCAYKEEQERRQQKATQAPAKPRSVTTDHSAGIIGKVCLQHDMDGELQRHGYRRVGKKYLSPDSNTGEPGVYAFEADDGTQRIYSHHGETDPLSNLNHNGHSLDVFDVLTELDYGGDVSRAVADMAPKVDPDGQKQRQRDRMAEKSREEAVETFGSAVTKEAQRIADRVHEQLLARLGVDPDQQPEDAESLAPDAERITRMINGAFWSGSKSKVFLLNHDESLIQFVEKDAFKFLARTFGNVIDRAAVERLAKKLDFGCKSEDAEENARRKHVSACMGLAKVAIIDHLKYHNQREGIEWRVDMFGKTSRLELVEDKARIVLTHRPLPLINKPESYARIIADYKEHFSRFDDFLKFVAMSRFALDRKKSYLWILADSDWGKGFLTGVLAKLGVCVETSMKEVEAMLEGKPVGRSAEDFKRAFVLLIDEFKTVKSELKQLQSEITLSPKNQLTCTVEVFAKVFTSAESVGSLVTENGVEDQFANRMSIFEEPGDITARPVFQEVGNSQYFRAVLAYTAEKLNREIGRMQRMGREAAETEAEQWLNDFIKRYGLDTVYERFSDSLPRLASEIITHLNEWDNYNPRMTVFDGETYVRSPSKVLDDYMVEHYDFSQLAAFRKKKPELLKMISEGGEGSKTHRIPGKDPFKAVKLRKL